MQTGWRVGSLFNIPLYIDNSWFLIVALITLSQGLSPDPDLAGVAAGSLGAWAAGLALALLLFASVLAHELGHSLVAISQGINVNSIKLFLFGGIASIESESKTPGQAFQVAAAGPAVSLVLFLLLTLVGNSVALPPTAQDIVISVARTNLILALFNLIPGLPLDGGQIFKAAVWKATNSRAKGVRWAAKSGQVVGFAGIAFGLWLFAFVPGSGLAGLWPALIGLFVLRNAKNYSRMNDLQEGLSKLKVSDAAIRDFRVLDAHMSLRQFADEYLLLDQKVAPVFFASSDGRYRGLVTIDSLRQVERSEWEYRDLNSIAKPLLNIPNVRENAPLTDAIELLEDKNLERLTVLSPADSVAGTLDRGDVVRAVARQMNFKLPEALIQRIKEEGAYPAGFQIAAIAQSIKQA